MTRMTEDYRNWTREVRVEARRKVAELRANRIARKRPAPSAAAETAPAPATAVQLPLTVSRRTAAMLAPAGGAAAPGALEPEIPEGAGDIAVPSPEPEDSGPPEMAGPVAAEPAPSAEAPDASAADFPPMQAPAPDITDAGPDTTDAAPDITDVAEDQDASTASPAPSEATGDASEPAAAASPDTPLDWDDAQLRSSDLHALPGIGRGLVWLLHANGISSLAELADAEPDALSDRLGLVGRLIDLRSWMEIARARTGTPAS